MSVSQRLAVAFVVFVALEHAVFFVLESFLWEKPVGRKIFGQSREQAAATAVLARNQGVYNAFLAAGLVWGLVTLERGGLGYLEFSRSILVFFLSCVGVAGVVGAVTVNRRIFFVQALPALIGLGWVLVA